MTQSCDSKKKDPYGTNEATVRGLTNSTDALAEKVRAALSSNAGLAGSEIKVAVSQEREVTLSGRVASLEQSNEAAKVARAVPGVGAVQNLLEVAGGNGQNGGGKNDNVAKAKPR